MKKDILKYYVIKTLLGGDNQGVYKTAFTYPYDDITYDVIIEFEIIKIPMWKIESTDCVYEGTIYIHINEILVGAEDEGIIRYESMSKDDVPSWVWDEFTETQFLEKLDDTEFCLDVNLDFPYE